MNILAKRSQVWGKINRASSASIRSKLLSSGKIRVTKPLINGKKV